LRHEDAGVLEARRRGGQGRHARFGWSGVNGLVARATTTCQQGERDGQRRQRARQAVLGASLLDSFDSVHGFSSRLFHRL
jgi:hypothetical protein